MNTINSPINPKEINIKITKVEPPDYKLEFEVPQRLVKRIHKKLKKGGMDYNDNQMTSLLIQICTNEGLSRLDLETVWGMQQMPGTKPPVFSLNKPFSFTAIVDTYTTSDIPLLKNITLKQIQLQATDELIELEIKAQRLECGQRDSYNGPLAIGDEIKGSASLAIEGGTEPLFEIDNVCIQIQESGRITLIDNLPFEGISEQLLDKELGETLKVNAIVPLTFYVEEQRGKTAFLTMNITSIERIKPATIEEVLQKYEIPNRIILQEQIRNSLKRSFENKNNILIINQLFGHLSDIFQLALSERLIQKLYDNLLDTQLPYSKENAELNNEHKRKLRTEARKIATRNTIRSLLGKHFELRISEEDINIQLGIIAEQERKRPHEIKEEYIAANKMDTLTGHCLEFKILNALEEHITYIDA